MRQPGALCGTGRERILRKYLELRLKTCIGLGYFESESCLTFRKQLFTGRFLGVPVRFAFTAIPAILVLILPLLVSAGTCEGALVSGADRASAAFFGAAPKVVTDATRVAVARRYAFDESTYGDYMRDELAVVREEKSLVGERLLQLRRFLTQYHYVPGRTVSALGVADTRLLIYLTPEVWRRGSGIESLERIEIHNREIDHQLRHLITILREPTVDVLTGDGRHLFNVRLSGIPDSIVLRRMTDEADVLVLVESGTGAKERTHILSMRAVQFVEPSSASRGN